MRISAAAIGVTAGVAVVGSVVGGNALEKKFPASKPDGSMSVLGALSLPIFLVGGLAASALLAAKSPFAQGALLGVAALGLGAFGYAFSATEGSRNQN